MRRLMLIVAATIAAATAGVLAWKRNRRLGTRFMNERVNPFLIQRGLAGRRGEIGTLEHIGRRSGTRRLTPVHPEPIENGFRIIVPLGPTSEWARNVMAAGHCRLELGGIVHELDEPAMVLPREMAELPAPARLLFGALGFTYLRLHRFAEHPGTLETTEALETAEQEPVPAGV